MLEAKDIIRRYEALRAKRDGVWLNVWREVRKYVMPTYSDYKEEGGIRGQEIFNTTAIKSRARLAAGMYSWMAPPDRRWFELVPQDEALSEDPEVKDYFGEVTRIVAVALANSNWPSVLIEALNNLACGLDGVIYCEDGGEQSILSFTSFPVETVVYAENSRGHVDTLFREVEMTSRQLVQEFSEDDLPDKIREEAGNPDKKDTKHKILHGVFPRCERQKDCLDQKNMPFTDVYIDYDSGKIISEGGFEEYPFAVCRFQKSDNETYGRGPGLDMLPTIKMANRMSQSYIVGREHQSDPSFLVPDGSLVSKNFNKDPGSVIVYKPDINGSKPEQLPNTTNFGTLYQDIAAVEEEIKLGFYWDIFDPLGDLKSITATEAEIRNEGKLIPFAPIAGNLHNELFRVIIHRAYGICLRRGILPQAPARLAENPDYKVEFVSKIALSIKQLETLGWLQTEAALMNMAQVKPEIIDNFDLDKIARSTALANGCAPNWLVSEEDREKARAARAEAAQQQQAADALLAGTSALGSNLGKAPEKGSPLEAVMSNQGV